MKHYIMFDKCGVITIEHISSLVGTVDGVQITMSNGKVFDAKDNTIAKIMSTIHQSYNK